MFLVAGVLLLSAYVARGPSLNYLLLLPASGSIYLFLRWPPLGLVALIAASLFIDFSVGAQLNITILLLALLCALWFLDTIVNQRSLDGLRSRSALPLIGLSVAVLISFGNGQLPWFHFAQRAPIDAQAAGVMTFLLSAGMFLLVAQQIKDLRWLSWMTLSFLVLGGLILSASVFPTWGSILFRYLPSGAAGSLLFCWLAAVACSQALLNTKLSIGARLLLGGIVACVFYSSFFKGRSWASGWIPAAIAMSVIIFVGKPRLRLLLILLGGAFFLIKFQGFVDGILNENQYSFVTRVEAWRILIEIVKVSPVLGLGPANYYYYTPLFSILGFYTRFNSHNNFVDIVAQTGLLGLVMFLWFAFEIGRLGWQLREKATEGFAYAYVIGCLGGLMGTLAAGMLGDWFLPFVYNVGLGGLRASLLGWMFLGGLVALGNILSQSKSQSISGSMATGSSQR